MHSAKLPDYSFMNYSTQTSQNQKQLQAKESLSFMRISDIFFRHLQSNAASAHWGGTLPMPVTPRYLPASSPCTAAPPGLGSKDLRARNSSHFCTEPADRSYSNRWLALGIRSLLALLPAAPSSPLARLLPACPYLHRGVPSSSSRHGSNTSLQTRLPQAPTAHLSLLS